MSGQEKREAAEVGQSFGGARADFVAGLGRKVADLRRALAAVEAAPRDEALRADLVRRLSTLATSARTMRFDAMAQLLTESVELVEAPVKAGATEARQLSKIARALDDLPAMAWTKTNGDAKPEALAPTPREADLPAPARANEGASGSEPVEQRSPMTVLVVGPEWVAETLLEAAEISRGRLIECERTEDAQAAIGLARALAPDVVLLEATVQHAEDLVEALADDPLTEPVPILAVGKLTSEQAARFVALGVARTLHAPFSGEALRSVVEEVVDQREGRTVRIALGEPTVEQLGERLADELRRALVDSVDPKTRGARVSLGEGTEVMAALWGAIARVREVVTARTGGSVRFQTGGPEGSIALAFQPDLGGADRTRRGRGAAADVNLEGRRVIVADDDPGVTWFLSDLLRTTGCVVHEALDGASALDLALRVGPDLVISDILMPKVDGFALSRALKRDVALRDTPVILLSWKEDLLQRVRELGASAAAYLRKESDARAILARVREVLWPRARVEARLKGTGEVRGRLDGLSVRTLLELVAVQRPNSRVSLRDASCLYEVELRDGAPRRATRTSGDGEFARGERVLGEMLGIGAGRFVVAGATPGATGQGGELEGTLAEQLNEHIARARGAMAATTGARTASVSRLQIDDAVLETYLRATPEPARSLVSRIAKGASPRELLLGGQVVPSLLDDLLVDLAARGAITEVWGEGDEDLLSPAVAKAQATLGGESKPRTPLSALRPSLTPPPVLGAAYDKPKEEESLQASLRDLLGEESAAPPAADEDAAPSSLQDAVRREAEPSSSSSEPPPIIEPSELKRRSNPPELTPDLSDDVSEPVAASAKAPVAAAAAPKRATPPPAPAKDDDEESIEIPPQRTPLSAVKASPKPAPKSTSTGTWVIGFAALALVGWMTFRLVGGGGGPAAPAAAGGHPLVQPLPEGAKVARGEGWLDVRAHTGAKIIVDGTEHGTTGAQFALRAGKHEVTVDDTKTEVDVPEGQSVKLDLAQP